MCQFTLQDMDEETSFGWALGVVRWLSSKWLRIITQWPPDSSKATYEVILLVANGSLVGGLEHFLFSIIYGIIIPTDFHIFQDG